MSEVEKTDQSVPPAATSSGVHVFRMFVGLLWLLVIFAIIGGVVYLGWPWIKHEVGRFYN
ncbi:MAG TPA: hypothetical protein VFE47_23355 [Tepidisphaeraceae bacterium]|nr:hypothetical protein [Tepidisphaeraceae bacterium]